MEAKLRTEKLKKRIAHDPKLQTKKSAQICKRIAHLPAFKKAKTILFYLPIHGEVDLSELFKKFAGKKTFVLPRMKGTTLQLHAIKNLTHTSKNNRYKIPEPIASTPKISPQKIDLVLAPGLAFDQSGNRIGYGKGYYDRLLAKIDAPKIGIAYQFQIVNNIPGQAHDIPMDIIVSEKRSLKARRKKINA